MMKNDRLDKLEINAGNLIREQFRIYGNGMVFLSSFSREDMIILHLIKNYNLEIDVFTLDTGRLPQETYDLMEKAKETVGIAINFAYPDPVSLASLISIHGPNLFYRNSRLRHECCNIRKVEPLKKILEGRRAWITGIRAEQTDLRSRSELIEKTDIIVKINPLLNWTYQDVEDYTKSRGIEENKLYSKGYKSIGCLPCTRPVREDEGEREGRWWWEDSRKECGIHYSKLEGAK